jgi:hypothetical protein
MRPSTRRILHRFLVADLAASRAEVGDVRALIVGSHLETGARARRVLLEDEGDVPAFEPLLLDAGRLRSLEIGSQPQQKADLVRAKLIEC